MSEDQEEVPTADELEDFRRRHWMHWNLADNLLISHLVARMRLSTPPAPEEDGLTDAEVDAIFDAHSEAPAMSYRYSVAQAVEVAVRMRLKVAVPSGVLDAIRRSGLTLTKTANGYELLKLGRIEAQAAQEPALAAAPQQGPAMSEDREHQEPDALSDDAIWRNDALMALNAKCQLPMSEFGKLVRRIVALTAPAAPEAVGEWTQDALEDLYLEGWNDCVANDPCDAAKAVALHRRLAAPPQDAPAKAGTTPFKALDYIHNDEELEMYVQERIEAATPLKQEGAEPVAWQWRRKGEPWSLEYTFNTSVFATTPETEVRPLYAQEPAPQGDAEDAARYRWLRDHWVEVHACPAKGRLTGVRILCEDDDGIGEGGERLDAAIDSARSGPRKSFTPRMTLTMKRSE